MCINTGLYLNYGVVAKSMVLYCVEKKLIYQYDFLYNVFITLCISIVSVVLISTCFLLKYPHTVEIETDNIISKKLLFHMLQAFSIENNIKRLVAPSFPPELSFLHTIKFLTMFGIVGKYFARIFISF